MNLWTLYCLFQQSVETKNNNRGSQESFKIVIINLYLTFGFTLKNKYLQGIAIPIWIYFNEALFSR